MNFKRTLAAMLTLMAVSVMVPAFAFNIMDDNLDQSDSYYLVTRNLEVGGSTTGELDLDRLKVVGPPMKLELRLRNEGSNPVVIDIPALESSFVLAPNSERIHYFSTLKVGEQRQVDYTARAIETRVDPQIDISSIQYILSSSYLQAKSDVQYQHNQESAGQVPATRRETGNEN